MRAVIQRVSKAEVTVDGNTVGKIGRGLLVLIAVHKTDTKSEAEWLARKIVNLRLFSDADGKMNLSLNEIGGEILAVSQFTLYGDCRKGRRPSYCDSASPKDAESLYKYFTEYIRTLGCKTETGQFQAHMEVSLLNDGPVTVIVDTPNGASEA